MQARKFLSLAFFFLIAGCTQIRSINLPEGITLLKGIEHSGLQAPLWSPDGKKIAASYVIEAMPDIAGFFGPKPRHDVVIIDTETWETSFLLSEKQGSFLAEAWSPDSKSFAMFWGDGPRGSGNYLFNIDGSKPAYLSKPGALSPDLGKIAVFDDPYIEIRDIHTQEVKQFKIPTKGKWDVYDWSPDMKQLTLTYQKNEERFENIYLLELDSGSFLQFTNESSFFKYSPTISPNGQLIAYGIWRFTEKDIEEKLLISRLDQSCEWTMPVNDIDYFAWSPDSQRMFLSGTDGVYVADLNTLFGSDFPIHCP